MRWTSSRPSCSTLNASRTSGSAFTFQPRSTPIVPSPVWPDLGREQRAGEVRLPGRGPQPRGGDLAGIAHDRPASRSSGREGLGLLGHGRPGRAAAGERARGGGGDVGRRAGRVAEHAPAAFPAAGRIELGGVGRASGGGSGLRALAIGSRARPSGAARRAGRSWAVDPRRCRRFSHTIARPPRRERRRVVVSFRVRKLRPRPRRPWRCHGRRRSRMTRVGPGCLSSPCVGAPAAVHACRAGSRDRDGARHQRLAQPSTTAAPTDARPTARRLITHPLRRVPERLVPIDARASSLCSARHPTRSARPSSARRPRSGSCVWAAAEAAARAHGPRAPARRPARSAPEAVQDGLAAVPRRSRPGDWRPPGTR